MQNSNKMEQEKLETTNLSDKGNVDTEPITIVPIVTAAWW